MIFNLPVATADGTSPLLLLTKRSSRNAATPRPSAANPVDRPRRLTSRAAAVLAAAADTPPAPTPVPPWSAPVADSKPLFRSNRAGIVRSSAVTASRLRKLVAAAADAAMIAAGAADATSPLQTTVIFHPRASLSSRLALSHPCDHTHCFDPEQPRKPKSVTLITGTYRQS
uniref:Uncharacterized protein n=1 Tax=mine drainage metagenome TaxID=410659 RepID=E6QI65_9ZZZZ